jgi:membrane protease YdiL (CAAX protease family)
VRRAAAAGRYDLATRGRIVVAIATVYAGGLGDVVVFSWLGPRTSESIALGVFVIVLVATGLLGVSILGPHALRRSLAFRPSARDLALGAVAGIAAFVIGWVYVRLLVAVDGDPGPRSALSPAAIAGAVAFAPVVEEWLCRGVLWDAIARLAPAPMVLAATAVLFALLHGIAWGAFGLPHRFVYGLLLGWVRSRTGSLVPGIVGHFLCNALAVAFG